MDSITRDVAGLCTVTANQKTFLGHLVIGNTASGQSIFHILCGTIDEARTTGVS